jgi:signal peptidase I
VNRSDPALSTSEPLGDAPTPATENPKTGTDWWREIKGIVWIVVGVLLFHSLVAKPFYIPSESMMPGLLKGDRLVVSKFPYGWSWISPSFHIFPPFSGRLFGRMPERGDIVIATPPGETSDYIKRVVGIPGDTIRMMDGRLYLNGQPVKREARGEALIPVDANVPCDAAHDQYGDHRARGPDGRLYCRLPVFRETLPGGRSYDTIDEAYSSEDNYGPIVVPPGQVFLMGDNRDNSADSRVPRELKGLGGPIPWENIGGRAEFITFSYDGSSTWLNPVSWVSALRGGRAGTSLHPHEAR